MSVRAATHAGSWYSDDAAELDAELTGFLARVPAQVRGIGPEPGDPEPVPVAGARAIIAPYRSLPVLRRKADQIFPWQTRGVRLLGPRGSLGVQMHRLDAGVGRPPCELFLLTHAYAGNASSSWAPRTTSTSATARCPRPRSSATRRPWAACGSTPRLWRPCVRRGSLRG